MKGIGENRSIPVGRVCPRHRGGPTTCQRVMKGMDGVVCKAGIEKNRFVGIARKGALNRSREKRGGGIEDYIRGSYISLGAGLAHFRAMPKGKMGSSGVNSRDSRKFKEVSPGEHHRKGGKASYFKGEAKAERGEDIASLWKRGGNMQGSTKEKAEQGLEFEKCAFLTP